jgi:3-hydroxyisobutyrate dehydrogenase-like beta-hydroxyacid dehydrogenase
MGTMADIRRIAVVGTGIMGAPMAGRLAEAGFSVKAWNRSAEKAAVLADKGVLAAATATEAVSESDAVLCMLSSGPVCNEVLLGPIGRRFSHEARRGSAGHEFHSRRDRDATGGGG